jgi:hypothetical protein
VSEIPGQRRPEKSKVNIDDFKRPFKGKKVKIFKKVVFLRVKHSIN